jgi:hypothetical protein
MAALALLTSGAALADPFDGTMTRDVITRNPPMTQPDSPNDSGLHVGIGVICNTGEQAQALVNLRARGTEIMSAVNSINEEANDPKACGVAAMAFERDKTISTESMNGKLVDIVRIKLLAGYDGRAWARVPQTTQYAIIESEGVAI